jgi:hypothetical protein
MNERKNTLLKRSLRRTRISMIILAGILVYCEGSKLAHVVLEGIASILTAEEPGAPQIKEACESWVQQRSGEVLF